MRGGGGVSDGLAMRNAQSERRALAGSVSPSYTFAYPPPRGTSMFARLSLLGLFATFTALPAAADGPADNIPDNVRPVPPKGNDIPADVRDEIKAGLADL